MGLEIGKLLQMLALCSSNVVRGTVLADPALGDIDDIANAVCRDITRRAVGLVITNWKIWKLEDCVREENNSVEVMRLKRLIDSENSLRNQLVADIDKLFAKDIELNSVPLSGPSHPLTYSMESVASAIDRYTILLIRSDVLRRAIVSERATSGLGSIHARNTATLHSLSFLRVAIVWSVNAAYNGLLLLPPVNGNQKVYNDEALRRLLMCSYAAREASNDQVSG